MVHFLATLTAPLSPDAPLQDNNSIYYEPVPDVEMLDPLPEPVVMMKPLPSKEEEAPTKILSFRATGSRSGKGGDGDSGEKSGKGEGDEGSSGAAGDGKPDAEIARMLHEKLNTS